MKTANILFSILTAGLLLISCSKDGDQGPIGPQGPQGEQGAQGLQGEQGEQGETGTANVVYSDWIPSEFGSQAAASLTSQLLHSFGAAEFDQNEDVALVYGRREVSAIQDDVFLLPYTHSSQEELYRHRTTTGSGFTAIYVEGTSTDGGNKVYTFFDDYRYVIIPGGNPASGKSSSVDYSKMSYREVIDLFNIPK